MSVDFFGVGGPGQIGSLNKPQKTQTNKKGDGGDDTVKFSSVLQDVKNASGSNKTEDTQRAERIQELKAQIEDGSYQPDLEKVSASLLQFLVDNR